MVLNGLRVRLVIFIGAALFVGDLGSVSGEPIHFVDPASPTSTEFDANWKPLQFRKIKRHTEYTLFNPGRAASSVELRAIAERSASAMTYEFESALDPNQRLKWEWRVDEPLMAGDVRDKATDDAAARIYVLFVYDPKKVSAWTRAKYKLAYSFYGAYPPGSSLNYIWGSSAPTGMTLKSPYTKRSAIITLRDRSDRSNVWLAQSVDIAEDYRRAFGLPDDSPVPKIKAIGLMSDSDNTKGRALAWFRRIQIEPGRAAR